MRNDFAVFILTHGRADNVATMGALKKSGYTGKWYMIIDDEDETVDQYYKNFGPEHMVLHSRSLMMRLISLYRWRMTIHMDTARWCVACTIFLPQNLSTVVPLC